MEEKLAARRWPWRPVPPVSVEALLRRLESRLHLETRQLVLYSRAAHGNHPCTWLGGFETLNEMSAINRRKWPVKGAWGWLSLREMAQATADNARAHGIKPGRHLLEGITDDVWELSSVDEIKIAVLGGDPLTQRIDMSRLAVQRATPNTPQGRVISFLRSYRNGIIAAVELPTAVVSLHLPADIRIRHHERHVLVFPDRVKVHDENLGSWDEVLPTRF